MLQRCRRRAALGSPVSEAPDLARSVSPRPPARGAANAPAALADACHASLTEASRLGIIISVIALPWAALHFFLASRLLKQGMTDGRSEDVEGLLDRHGLRIRRLVFIRAGQRKSDHCEFEVQHQVLWLDPEAGIVRPEPEPPA